MTRPKKAGNDRPAPAPTVTSGFILPHPVYDNGRAPAKRKGRRPGRDRGRTAARDPERPGSIMAGQYAKLGLGPALKRPGRRGRGAWRTIRLDVKMWGG